MDLSDMFGVRLDDWQRLILEAAMGERSDAKWAAQRVGVSVPRQNGKSQLLVARALAGALLFGEKKIVISAHQQDTAREAFAKLMEIIEADANEALRSRLDRRFGRDGVMNAINRESVRFTTGATIQFKSRSGTAGKGFSSDCLLLDEAQILGSRAWTSINSTMSAMPNPQVWLLGTPPQEEDDCFAFEAVRRSALDGKSTNAAYVEWSADPAAEDFDPASEFTRWQANPAWNVRLNHEVVQGEFETYTAEKFSQDRLGIWRDSAGLGGAVDPVQWAASSEAVLGVELALPDGKVSVGVATDQDRTWASVVWCWPVDGRFAVDVVRNEGVDWVIPYLAGRSPRILTVCVDSGGPAATLLPGLGEARLPVRVGDTNGARNSHADLVDAVKYGRFIHRDDPVMNTAARMVKWRTAGGGQVFARRDSGAPIDPLEAAAWAMWGYTPDPKRKEFFMYNLADYTSSE